MLDKFDYVVSSNEDMDKLKLGKNNFGQINSLQLDFRGGLIDKSKFTDFFENQVAKAKNLERIELDLTNFRLNNDSIDLIVNSFKNLTNLKDVEFHISESRLSNEQFDRLLNDSFGGKSSIKKLHLVLENINVSDAKRRSVEKLIKSLPNLNHTHINMQRNFLTRNDVTDIHDLVYHLPFRVLLW